MYGEGGGVERKCPNMRSDVEFCLCDMRRRMLYEVESHLGMVWKCRLKLRTWFKMITCLTPQHFRKVCHVLRSFIVVCQIVGNPFTECLAWICQCWLNISPQFYTWGNLSVLSISCCENMPKASHSWVLTEVDIIMPIILTSGSYAGLAQLNIKTFRWMRGDAVLSVVFAGV